MSPMDIDAPLVKIRNRLKRVPRDVVDIDAVNDPLQCSQYAQDICDYLQVKGLSSNFFSFVFSIQVFSNYLPL